MTQRATHMRRLLLTSAAIVLGFAGSIALADEKPKEHGDAPGRCL